LWCFKKNKNLQGCGFVSHAVFIGWLGRFLYTSLGRGVDMEKVLGRIAYFYFLFFWYVFGVCVFGFIFLTSSWG